MSVNALGKHNSVALCSPRARDFSSNEHEEALENCAVVASDPVKFEIDHGTSIIQACDSDTYTCTAQESPCEDYFGQGNTNGGGTTFTQLQNMSSPINQDWQSYHASTVISNTAGPITEIACSNQLYTHQLLPVSNCSIPYSWFHLNDTLAAALWPTLGDHGQFGCAPLAYCRPVYDPSAIFMGAKAQPGLAFPSAQFLPQQVTRRRRALHVLEKPFTCGWNGCDKSYGALNHLNSHVTSKKHGPRRDPKDFKEASERLRQKKLEAKALRKLEAEYQRDIATTAVAFSALPVGPVYAHATDGTTATTFTEVPVMQSNAFLPMPSTSI
ncbi:hypothetical protein BGZ63DRAFT_135612 [Mariannaea sp. PMI_226]|nr:hypothetical protein BGZ63DRAFT_135612 [Mariannaea sp. PMI_226]